MINLKLTIFYYRNLSEGAKDEIRSFYKQLTTRYCSFSLKPRKLLHTFWYTNSKRSSCLSKNLDRMKRLDTCSLK